MIELPLKLVALEEDNYHLIVEGTFPDEEKACWIVDTGASKTVFDSTLEKYYTPAEAKSDEEFHSAGISVGHIETSLGCISFCLGEIEIEELTVALIDLNHVNEIYNKYSDIKVVGLLGSDILKKYGCLIDYRSEKITFIDELENAKQ